jgi:hypothetical protein
MRVLEPVRRFLATNAPIIHWDRVLTAIYDRPSPYCANGHPVLRKIQA